MRYRFDEFALDTGRFELTRGGEVVHAEPQVIELLVLLVENRDRLVSRDEINEKVWRGRVVSDAALSSRIKMARQLLGDDGGAQRLIRTIHKKGFRFVGQVRHDGECGAQGAAEMWAPGAAAEAGAAAGESAAKPAVAVLPLTNLSADADQEYLADGITTDLIGRLARYRWLSVVARNTCFGYKGRAVDVRQLRDELSVDYVVEGSMQRAGNRIRISAQLIDTRSGHSKWGEHYDRELADIFALQDEITETVAARLEPEIGFAERDRVIHARPANLQAWDCYHLGIYHLFKFTGPDNREAQTLLQRSSGLDPLLGEAHAWWAYAVVLGMVYWDTEPRPGGLDEALAACDRALALDPHNATFHALRARVLLARREYDMAIAENEAAIELNPSFAAAHCGLGDSLAYEMRYAESVECFRKAIALSPNDPQLWAFYTYGALALIFQGDYSTALEWTDRASRIPNCQYWTTAHRAVALAYLERDEEARQTAARLLQECPRFSCTYAREKLFYLKEPLQIEKYLAGLQRAGVPAH